MIDWAWAYLFGEHGVRLIAPSDFSPAKGSAGTAIADQMDVLAEVHNRDGAHKEKVSLK
jgi:hypothetical protein